MFAAVVSRALPNPALSVSLRYLWQRSLLFLGLLFVSSPAFAAGDSLLWWQWALILFFVCLFIGVVAVPAGVGGGILFVPIVSAFFPFHLDFIRGAGLLVALASAIAAGPLLLRCGLSHLRLALPLALLASLASIAGALIGLALPERGIRIALGATILLISLLFVLPRSDSTDHIAAAGNGDRWAALLGMHGRFLTPEGWYSWQAKNSMVGFLLFLVSGALAGLFGLGAGWANVAVLNLVMGVPIKVAAASSGLILSLVDTAAAWVYINAGAIMVAIALPAILGMMLGARVGARLLTLLPAHQIRWGVILLLFLSSLRLLWQGLFVS